MKKLLLGLGLSLLSFSIIAQTEICTDTSNLYVFQHNNKNYAIVKDTKSWTDAIACAYQLGGILAIIDNQEEQDAIWAEIPNANITNSNTSAPDGGQASYLWIGGSDMGEEGKWEWIGENGDATQFWQGTNSGSAVGGLYNNWGSSSFAGEPDNYLGNQNALGFALTDWPYGSAGQWNDLNVENLLYFIIESEIDTTSGNGDGDGGDGGGTDSTVAVTDYNIQSSLIYPNPSSSYFKIMRDDIKEITIINALGQEVYRKINRSKTINISHLREGIYFVKMTTNENQLLINTLKVIK
ncbi:MAG: T9SS type A sorting domain-containing protein [Flavobacteriales bacterium]|nr:T9SS type A sorting domain-containing protein [Flavobacteriales bacterium]MBL6872394.1 T9SS type A sorting domain-containing protein [Flavobacteriales bacterium]